MPDADIAVIGAGAAGLFAAIWAGRTRPNARIIALDGAAKLGAKILVAGGGRCNVTHDAVSETAYAGSSRNAIRKVLKRFDVPETVEFFRELGVELKREETGKLFPVTDSARTVLDALLRAADHAGVQIMHPRRVEAVERISDGFAVRGSWGTLTAKRVILATGGRSLPKSGSDGHGYQIAKALGHALTPRIFPALVPLTLPSGHPLMALSGISADVTLNLRDGNNKLLTTFDGAMLCTHFGLSGPVVLDISRYWEQAVADDPAARLSVNWLPAMTTEQADRELADSPKLSALRWIDGRLVERLARMLCGEAGVDPVAPLGRLTRAERQALARVLTDMPLSVTGTRGYTYAEVTAGGVPLTEIDLKTMASRICPGLYLCGELCDVDGRIGGYNFQWAWASGYVAGIGAATNT
jgi:predicted Rossmann fold flavoprotein